MLLGINQHEFAMLLGINRVQVALYETGKRQLPSSAYGKFADIMVQVTAQQALSKPEDPLPKNEKQKLQLEGLLRENQYQFMTCERRITTVQKKQDATVKMQQLMVSLNTQSSKGPSEKAAGVLISSKASEYKSDLLSADLLKLEIRLEVLKFEKQLLEKKLKELV
jgi:transcriptional regulator with XRE-family HTH domain